MSNGKDWTAQEVSRLRAYVALGMKRKEILERFPGVDYWRLARKMNALGLRTERGLDPASRHRRAVCGVRAGSLARSLKGSVRAAVMDHAVRHGSTMAEAVQHLLDARL